MGKYLDKIRQHEQSAPSQQDNNPVLPALPIGDWHATWRELAALTFGLTAEDQRLSTVMDALNKCDDAYLGGDWSAFRQAAEQVRNAVAGRNPHGKV